MNDEVQAGEADAAKEGGHADETEVPRRKSHHEDKATRQMNEKYRKFLD